MIGRLTGVIAEKAPPQVLVDVAGVGYEVDVPMSTFYNLPNLGERTTLLTHFVVREDAQILFGFGTAQEREAFRQLIKISGVGPRTALALLSGMSVSELAQAVSLQEAGRLTKIPGIGKKTAERIVLELKEKVGMPEPSAPSGELVARDALVELGWTLVDAERALRDVDEGLPVEEQVRLALRRAA